MIDSDIKELLEIKAEEYNNKRFIEDDPILIPHLFTDPGDIEISAFLTATISWGNRKSIINNAKHLMQIFDWSPYDFVLNHTESDKRSLNNFVHRTFNSIDLKFFITSLQNLLCKYGSLQNIFYEPITKGQHLYKGITHFRDVFLGISHPVRTLKHIPDIERGSAAKRLNMFLRWMVRQDKKGVDFGIWNNISPALLYLPLDVHTANASRKLGLLNRRANDWKAVLEVTLKLRELNPDDPILYDFALFGLSRFDKI